MADGALDWQVWLTKGDGTEGAGVGVWSTPSVDAERGLLFVGTGNTYEPPASTMADSIVAIRYDTGEVAWSHQFTFPDVFSGGYQEGADADVGAGPNLWEQDGRSLVGAGDKTGTYYALDRDTGEVVWQTADDGGSALGGVIGTSALDDTQIYVGSNVGDPETHSPTGKAKVLALSRDGGAIAWEQEVDGAIYAPISMSPGVVYAATTAGTMYALDVRRRRPSCGRTPPRTRSAAAPPSSTAPSSGAGASPCSAAARARAGSSRSAPAAAPAPDRRDTVANEIRAAPACSAPSAPAATAARARAASAPPSSASRTGSPLDQHLAVVNGGRGSSQMPAFRNALTPEEIAAVVEYERTQLGG